ncbi:MAG TPA: glucose-6-phosphate isomerase [Actinomycetota bacterium]|nr:glucose-6-phosphate isomerase [Actinomycetota bacterium]
MDLPPPLSRAVARRLKQLGDDDVVRRIWEKDHTVWRDDPTEITDRLGWLTVPNDMRDNVSDLKRFAEGCAADGLTTAVLAGMGGSSLAPEVLRMTLGVAPGMLDLVVLDTTHPDAILGLERSLDLDRTLFIVSSKSGTTTETNSHFAYFWDKVGDGSRFVAITDPDTPLEKLAGEHGFRRTFLNPPDIGGRYSALSYFGLVPGALIGADLEALLESAFRMVDICRRSPGSGNTGAALGAIIAEGFLAGRDKLTLVLPDGFRSLGFWVEQLIAESTGKDGKGIVPVEGEALGTGAVYGRDRLFVGVGSGDVAEKLRPLEDQGHPAVLMSFGDSIELGAAFFQWEFATAVAGAIIRIHPFDQPNVQEAKDATEKVLSTEDEGDPGVGDLNGLLGEIGPGDYLAIQAFLPRNDDTDRRLRDVRMRLRDRLRVATTVGFGPRFLHSTGQLHKGGPNTGVFIQVVERPDQDIPIPGKPYSFGRLIAAQAEGDLRSLQSHGRRVARVGLSDLEGV